MRIKAIPEIPIVFWVGISLFLHALIGLWGGSTITVPPQVFLEQSPFSMEASFTPAPQPPSLLQVPAVPPRPKTLTIEESLSQENLPPPEPLLAPPLERLTEEDLTPEKPEVVEPVMVASESPKPPEPESPVLQSPRIDETVAELPDSVAEMAGVPELSPPSLIKNPTPKYPRWARRQGCEGVVHLTLWVDKRGGNEKIAIKQSSGFKDLDDYARSFVLRHWRFSPATQDGISIGTSVDLRIAFSLEDS